MSLPTCWNPSAVWIRPGSALEPEVTTDVLVLGGGGAGVTAALFAESLGARVLLATKLRLGNSNTIMALGGMQAAVAEQDSPIKHFADTMIAGGFAGKRQLVKAMVEDGPGYRRMAAEDRRQFRSGRRTAISPPGWPPACRRPGFCRSATIPA